MNVLKDDYLKNKGFIEIEPGIFEKQFDKEVIIKMIKSGTVFIPSVLHNGQVIEHNIKIDNNQDLDEYLSYIENKFKI